MFFVHKVYTRRQEKKRKGRNIVRKEGMEIDVLERDKALRN